MAEGEEFRLRAGGEDLIGWTWGEGPTVILVHGWEGRGTQLGAMIEPLTAAGLRVVAVDAPAHGESSGRRSSMPQFADTVRAVEERFRPVCGVVGHSFGAAATSLAIRNGVRFPRLVFIAPPGDMGEYANYFATLLGLSEQTRTEMIALLERRFEVSWEELRRASLTPTANIPLLVVHDEGDRDSPITNGHRVAAAWPGSRLIATSGLGHRRILRDPTVIATIVDFLTSERISRAETGPPSRLKIWALEVGESVQEGFEAPVEPIARRLHGLSGASEEESGSVRSIPIMTGGSSETS